MINIRPKTLQNLIHAVFGLKNVVKSNATCETSVKISASNFGSEAMISDVEVKMLDGSAIGAAVLVNIDEESKVSSNPSRYIWRVVGFRRVRFAKDGMVLATRPSTLTVEAVIIQKAIERFIDESFNVSIWFFLS